MTLSDKQILDIIKEREGIEPSQIVCLMRFGSKLYGTDTPESDTDVKGVYIPNLNTYLKQEVRNAIVISSKVDREGKKENIRNSNEDYDIELFTLDKFIADACSGQTYSLDMLYAPNDFYVRINNKTTRSHNYSGHQTIWTQILLRKHEFLQQDLYSFVGYAQKQAGKYGLKGSRLAALQEVVDYLSRFNQQLKLFEVEIWDNLPTGDHSSFHTDEKTKMPMYVCCDRKTHQTVKVGYARDMYQKAIDGYGKRAIEAKENKNVDWKAMSHAVRAADELKQLFTNKHIQFPLETAPHLLDIKLGKIPYVDVANELESKMDEMVAISQQSGFPKKLDSSGWENWVLMVLRDIFSAYF